ncbi:MAG: hypothetical protein ACOCUU_02615 [Nanoarchaeota archaeon]
MNQINQLLFGIFFLFLGIPIGNLLSRLTKEELKKNQKNFRIILITALLGSLISALIQNKILSFSFLFISIITSRCIK